MYRDRVSQKKGEIQSTLRGLKLICREDFCLFQPSLYFSIIEGIGGVYLFNPTFHNTGLVSCKVWSVKCEVWSWLSAKIGEVDCSVETERGVWSVWSAVQTLLCQSAVFCLVPSQGRREGKGGILQCYILVQCTNLSEKYIVNSSCQTQFGGVESLRRCPV